MKNAEKSLQAKISRWSCFFWKKGQIFRVESITLGVWIEHWFFKTYGPDFSHRHRMFRTIFFSLYNHGERDRLTALNIHWVYMMTLLVTFKKQYLVSAIKTYRYLNISCIRFHGLVDDICWKVDMFDTASKFSQLYWYFQFSSLNCSLLHFLVFVFSCFVE